MPMVMDLGLAESCMLALERRLPERRGHGLPRFGALREVKPLRPAYLVILLGVNYNGAVEGQRGW